MLQQLALALLQERLQQSQQLRAMWVAQLRFLYLVLMPRVALFRLAAHQLADLLEAR
jgi:hypothetical protein